MRSKYNAKKVEVGGILFDSKHEAQRWQELQILQRAGVISQLKRQVRFDLVPPQGSERGVYYVADFTYLDKSGKFVVEDAKGFKTPEYIIKRKLMLWLHKIKIREV